jgi:hypothetical protein
MLCLGDYDYSLADAAQSRASGVVLLPNALVVASPENFCLLVVASYMHPSILCLTQTQISNISRRQPYYY